MRWHVIVGEYIRPDSESGLRRDPRGRITTFDIPGVADTEAADINDRGVIASTRTLMRRPAHSPTVRRR
jgi:hypothetical protein